MLQQVESNQVGYQHREPRFPYQAVILYNNQVEGSKKNSVDGGVGQFKLANLPLLIWHKSAIAHKKGVLNLRSLLTEPPIIFMPHNW